MDEETVGRRVWRMSNTPLVILLVVLGGVWWLGRGVPPAAQDGVQQARLGFDDVAETTAEIVRADGEGAAQLVLAGTWLDGVVGVMAAAAVGAPVIIGETASLPSPLLQLLLELDPEEVVVVGGEAGISAATVNVLETVGYAVTRVSADDRHATAVEVTRRHGDVLGELEGRRTAILGGDGFVGHLLPALPLSYAARLPVLLTPADAAPPAVVDIVTELGIEVLLVPGGEVAVAESVLETFRDAGVDVERVGGDSFDDTSAAFAEVLQDRLGWDVDSALLTAPARYDEALAATRYAALNELPILLAASPEALGPATRRWLVDACDVERVEALGDVAVVSDDVLAEATAAAAECDES